MSCPTTLMRAGRILAGVLFRKLPALLLHQCACRQHLIRTPNPNSASRVPPCRRSLIVSLLWCVYNAVPPALMLQYAAFKEHGLAEVCRVASAVTFIAGAGESLKVMSNMMRGGCLAFGMQAEGRVAVYCLW